MLENHQLLIDQNCPMCSIYGKAFIKTKRLDKEAITYYQTANETTFEYVDSARAKSEVALLNKSTKEVVYGADAFAQIVHGENNFLKGIYQFKPIHFLIQKLYRFISYNRHVITGEGNLKPGIRTCKPPVHKTYRWAYLIFAALFTGLMVNQFALALNTELGLQHNNWREYAICFGQVAWQFIALSIIAPKKRLNYLGNMSTISIIGGLLLCPLLILNNWFDFSWFGLLVSFGGVVSIMFLLHIKRCKQQQLPLITSFSWVAYRTLILGLIVLTTLI